mmetsp:Transcript_28708/g.71116  ORF Transcript_28708/g.71116 Transcript_28708/m.71116 type:complete len:272 (-) Transcript_28708:863-1678(-)
MVQGAGHRDAGVQGGEPHAARRGVRGRRHRDGQGSADRALPERQGQDGARDQDGQGAGQGLRGDAGAGGLDGGDPEAARQGRQRELQDLLCKDPLERRRPRGQGHGQVRVPPRPLQGRGHGPLRAPRARERPQGGSRLRGHAPGHVQRDDGAHPERHRGRAGAHAQDHAAARGARLLRAGGAAAPQGEDPCHPGRWARAGPPRPHRHFQRAPQGGRADAAEERAGHHRRGGQGRRAAQQVWGQVVAEHEQQHQRAAQEGPGQAGRADEARR